jgi:PIN domain nuclease of toxin-antitoxin system
MVMYWHYIHKVSHTSLFSLQAALRDYTQPVSNVNWWELQAKVTAIKISQKVQKNVSSLCKYVFQTTFFSLSTLDFRALSSTIPFTNAVRSLGRP